MPFLTQGRTNWKFLLIVFILVVIAGGGILTYQYWWLPKHEIKPPEITIKDETANWQSYRNEKYGFEVKYPRNYFFEVCEDELLVFSPIEELLIKCGTEATPVIGIEVSPENAEELNYDIQLFSQRKQAKIDTITVGGESAIKIESLQDSEGGDYKSIVVLFVHNRNLYRLYYNEIPEVDLTNIFNQILSTFKFID